VLGAGEGSGKGLEGRQGGHACRRKPVSVFNLWDLGLMGGRGVVVLGDEERE